MYQALCSAIDHPDLGSTAAQEGLEGSTLPLVVGVDPPCLVPDADDVGGVDLCVERAECGGHGLSIAIRASWPGSGFLDPDGSGRSESPENSPGRVEDRSETCDDCLVPLSEDEQRILRQIEQELEQDPTFSQRGYRVSRRRSILLALGLILGLVITIGGLAVSFVVAFGGFVLVLVMAIMLESELRLLGRERLGQLPISAWLSGRRPDVDDDVPR